MYVLRVLNNCKSNISVCTELNLCMSYDFMLQATYASVCEWAVIHVGNVLTPVIYNIYILIDFGVFKMKHLKITEFI